MHRERQAEARRRRGAARPRVVLLIALAVVAAAGLLGWASPWILPARIVEGPLIQRTDERGATLVWYTSRRAACEVITTVDGTECVGSASVNGTRHVAHVSGLHPDEACSYRIRTGKRTLAAAHFRTAKPAATPFAFLVFGDSGKGSREQYLLARDMATVPVDFILHTGDVVYPSGERRDYRERFFEPYRDLLSQVSFWPCLGNHDTSEENHGAPYLEVFDLPENGPPGLPAERNYWFDYAAARVAVIDSNLSEEQLRDFVAPWLVAVLSAPGPRWKFAVLHHPPYTAGKHRPHEGVRRTLVPVFEAAGVDIVFAGHDHNYQRTQPLRGGELAAPGGGVVYVVTGAGGARLYEGLPPEQRPAYIAALHAEVHSFTHVTIEGDRLTLRQIALGGKKLDEWALEKPPPVDSGGEP